MIRFIMFSFLRGLYKSSKFQYIFIHGCTLCLKSLNVRTCSYFILFARNTHLRTIIISYIQVRINDLLIYHLFIDLLNNKYVRRFVVVELKATLHSSVNPTRSRIGAGTTMLDCSVWNIKPCRIIVLFQFIKDLFKIFL